MTPQRTSLLLLGVSHLRAGLPDDALTGALDRLRAWAPDLIAIEALDGGLVEQYEGLGGDYRNFRFGGAPMARAAREAAQRCRPEPWTRAEPDAGPRHDCDASDRATAVAALLCRGEPHNALLHPWRSAALPEAASHVLAELEADPSERVRVAVRLARNLGHTRLAHIDEHPGLGANQLLPVGWRDIRMANVRAMQATTPEGPPRPGDEDQWSLWRWLASPAVVEWLDGIQALDRDETGDPTGVLRALQHRWHGRNLAMAARICQACATIPAGRVLVIIGHSHLGPLRRALALHPGSPEVVTAADLA